MTDPADAFPAAELPVLRTAAFEQTAAALPRAALTGYLQTLLERGQALLTQLSSATAPDPPMAAAAHSLAGSAGMFGFERLAVSARYFEHAVAERSPRIGILQEHLIAATRETIAELRLRIAAG